LEGDRFDSVPEIRFGAWFLSTKTWALHVIWPAVEDPYRPILHPEPSYPLILDVGCGWGHSLRQQK
jgi:hypothetical protein